MMKTNYNSAYVKNTIKTLEAKQAYEWELILSEFDETLEQIKPMNLVKNTFNKISSSPDIKEDVINSTLGAVSGFLSKKFLLGNTHNPLKKALGILVQMGITGLVTKNAEGIRGVGSFLLHEIIQRKKVDDKKISN